MKHALKLVRICILLSVCLTACKGLSPFSSGPASVVKTMYMDCNTGNYSKVEDLLTSDAKTFLSGNLGTLAGGVKGICDQGTRNGSVTSIDTISEDIRGEGATVKSKIHYKDGSSMDDSTSLMKVNGVWLVTIGP
jgi:Domain of unknown function (DUF4878)